MASFKSDTPRTRTLGGVGEKQRWRACDNFYAGEAEADFGCLGEHSDHTSQHGQHADYGCSLYFSHMVTSLRTGMKKIHHHNRTRLKAQVFSGFGEVPSGWGYAARRFVRKPVEQLRFQKMGGLPT